MSRRHGIPLLLFLLSVSLASCAQGGGAQPSSALGRPAPSGQLTVPLKIVQGPTRSTLALVPVSIEGQGPYDFALDTGASNSTIDTTLAKKLNLQQVGSAGQVTGVAAMTQAQFLGVSKWQVGDIMLPETKLIGVELGGPNAQAGLAGLLGSDILSQYGAVTIDYGKKFLVLRAKVSASVQAAASQAPTK